MWTYNYELYHWGVKGMKWGVRRYQNSDGSLTDAGKKRYDRDLREGGKKKAKAPDADRWVHEDMERTKKLTDATSHMTNELKRANDTATKNRPKTQMDLSKMTDKELRDQINRKLMERQYNDLFAPENTSRGREHVGKILDSVGTTLAITSSALGIALAIKELKG